MAPGALEQLHRENQCRAPRPARRHSSYKSIPQGAATTVWAGVVAPAEAVGGLYCEDCHVAELVDGAVMRGGVRPYALDPARAKALWAKSEELVGEKF